MDPNITASISELVKSTASKYDNQRVVILGKGASADAVEQGVFDSSLVIGLNDSEWIAQCDISIFHEPWVYESLGESGFRSDLYLTNLEVDPGTKTLVTIPYIPLANDASDMMMSRLLDSSRIELEEVMLLTALKLALMVGKMRGSAQDVYLVGMDFDPKAGYSKKIKGYFDPALSDLRVLSVESQEHFLKHAMYLLRQSDVRVHHIGDREFSSMKASELNAAFGVRPAFLEPNIRPVQEVVVTAEITTNHFGDKGRLERLIRECKAAGADYVKFQKRDVESFYSESQLDSEYASPFGKTFRDYRLALELDFEDFRFIDDLTAELEIGWFLSVLDRPSFDFIKDLNPAMIKLPSTISEHKEYLEFVASDYDGDLVLSTGMTDTTYENWVLETFTRQRRLYLLHANSAYPTPEQDCNIGVIRHYSSLSERNPKIIPGWSSHDPGWLGSALAVAAGARMVEKHVKLGNTEWAHFDSVALDLSSSAFREYVAYIRKAELIVGSSTKRITPSENHKYKR